MSEQKIEVGLKGTAAWIVDEKQLASAVGSGSVEVFSTPFLVALCEAAAVNALKNSLKSEETSVGTNVNVSHLAATPVGVKVSAEATVTAVEGRKVKFSVVANDAKEKIGEGTHERFILNKEKFVSKAKAKAQQ